MMPFHYGNMMCKDGRGTTYDGRFPGVDNCKESFCRPLSMGIPTRKFCEKWMYSIFRNLSKKFIKKVSCPKNKVVTLWWWKDPKVRKVLFCPAKEKLHNSRFFINRVHGSARMFRVYSIAILHENAAVKRTVLPKGVKQNDISHYFWKKLSKKY